MVTCHLCGDEHARDMRELGYNFCSTWFNLGQFFLNIGHAVEARLEREKVEHIYGLTGGELNRDAWGGYLYNYDGVPEWAEDDFPNRLDPGGDYVTCIDIDAPYGTSDDPIECNGKVYVPIMSYQSGGERECPCGPCGAGEEVVGEEGGETEGMSACPLCEAEAGEPHGMIYLGEGAEIVYRAVDPVCAECGLNRADALDGDCDYPGHCRCADDYADAMWGMMASIVDWCEAQQ